ncbi:hypothetical protein J2X72_004479 [Phyllobacterium sp. 1468]|nr:hypothetical protein [Phyllobacterium sp. 1468]
MSFCAERPLFLPPQTGLDVNAILKACIEQVRRWQNFAYQVRSFLSQSILMNSVSLREPLASS